MWILIQCNEFQICADLNQWLIWQWFFLGGLTSLSCHWQDSEQERRSRKWQNREDCKSTTGRLSRKAAIWKKRRCRLKCMKHLVPLSTTGTARERRNVMSSLIWRWRSNQSGQRPISIQFSKRLGFKDFKYDVGDDNDKDINKDRSEYIQIYISIVLGIKYSDIIVGIILWIQIFRFVERRIIFITQSYHIHATKAIW